MCIKRIRDTLVAFCEFLKALHFVHLCYHKNYNHSYNGNQRNSLAVFFKLSKGFSLFSGTYSLLNSYFFLKALSYISLPKERRYIIGP
jgi:hypothetical protein